MKKKKMTCLWRWWWLLGLTNLLLLVLGIGPSQASHIMESESAESMFEMIDNNVEVVGDEVEESQLKKGDKLPAQGPFQPPHLQPDQEVLDEETMKELDLKSVKLRKIEQLSTGLTSEGCMGNHEYEMMRDVILSTEFANVIMEKVDMIVSFLYKLKKYETRIRNRKEVERDEQEVYKYVFDTVKEAYEIRDVRLLIYSEKASEQTIYTIKASPTNSNLTKSREKNAELSKKPWFFNPNSEFDHSKFFTRESNPMSTYHQNKLMDLGMNGGSYWSWPYFNCSSAKHRKVLSENELIIRSNPSSGDYDNSVIQDEPSVDESRTRNRRQSVIRNKNINNFNTYSHTRNNNQNNLQLKNAWFASYTAWFPIHVRDSIVEEYGELSLDLDMSDFEINQCGFDNDKDREWDMKHNPLHYFRDTHKCDRLRGTSSCHFIKGHPWRGFSYECKCKKNNHAYNRNLNNTIAGAIAEAAWVTMRENKTNGNDSIMYQDIVTCKACPDGCDDCIDGISCLAPISWVFRLVILCVSVICSIGSIILIFVTYKFRKAPVLKSSSPLFHCITLLGCVIMYSEMIALFPVLSQATCIAVKWTRHLGFCVTYSALYMKLCRVYLTFRVKSAHKIKLTEKHLLHWMSPIMVVMLLYLFAWTISDPPSIEPMATMNDLKFYQCVYNWWDHALAIGEVIFLAYGVWICWRIRENPDAQFISYSIYNIAFTNVLMVSLHLLILPQAGPDMKYFLAFARTQLSTTITIALVFGSKLLTVVRGDAKAMKDIPTSANGFGHETLDLAEENQQLKEELTKMATQIEKLKSYAMCKNNPHLKHSSINVNVTTDADFNKLDAFSSL